MRMRTFFGVSALTLFVVAGSAGYVWWELDRSSSTDTQPVVSASSQQEQPAVTAGSSGNEQRLQVKGATDTMSQSSQQEPTNDQPEPQQSRLPEPSEFSVYEEYAAAEGPLYIDIVEGAGQAATQGVRVAMYYQGWLTNGTLFDQTRSDESGVMQPFIFELGSGQVIAGWDQGIVGMKEGGKRRLVIPAQFAYGDSGQGSIPPNSLLVFDVQLLAIQ